MARKFPKMKELRAGRRINNIPRQEKEAEKLYLKGRNKREIAEQVGVSLMTIYRWAKKNNWEEKYVMIYKEHLSKIKDPLEMFQFKISWRTPKISKNLQKLPKTFKEFDLILI